MTVRHEHPWGLLPIEGGGGKTTNLRNREVCVRAYNTTYTPGERVRGGRTEFYRGEGYG